MNEKPMESNQPVKSLTGKTGDAIIDFLQSQNLPVTREAYLGMLFFGGRKYKRVSIATRIPPTLPELIKPQGCVHFFLPALTFAHRFRWAALILASPCGER
jgi:hypothetical protein